MVYICTHCYWTKYMTINDKIKQILIERNFTPSYFADEIGVQRSSISHILSGRNRPSFDIIQKIIRRFPELGYEWIMEEEAQYAQPQPGNRFSSQNSPAVNSTKGQEFSGPRSTPSPTNGSFRSTRQEVQIDDDSIENADLSAPRKVERILMFYDDGSFQEYKPA